MARIARLEPANGNRRIPRMRSGRVRYANNSVQPQALTKYRFKTGIEWPKDKSELYESAEIIVGSDDKQGQLAAAAKVLADSIAQELSRQLGEYWYVPLDGGCLLRCSSRVWEYVDEYNDAILDCYTEGLRLGSKKLYKTYGDPELCSVGEFLEDALPENWDLEAGYKVDEWPETGVFAEWESFSWVASAGEASMASSSS